MQKKHCLIIVPGLGDNISLVGWTLKDWNKKGVTVIVYPAPWNRLDESFDRKLERLVREIDKYYTKGFRVSLLGISAGAGLVLNAYVQRKKKIHKVILVCGRLRTGEDLAHWYYKWNRRSEAFYDSVLLSEQNQKSFTKDDFKKFLVFSALYDDLVPLKTSVLPQSKNIRLPMVGHIFSIGYTLLFKQKEIWDFIKD